jgi:molecular chaperone DnaK
MPTFAIDLGTTYSCVAYIDGTGRATVAKNRYGNDTTPSVIHLESADHFVVGEEAKNSARIAPDQVVSLIKREMGKDTEFTFHGVRHTPESLSALILKDITEAARESTGEEVRDVVITVPAYFGLAEREATRKAGEIAGLNVLNLVEEPVAAALHYDVTSVGGGFRNILVYDLGGGTFDTTVIQVSGDNINVICTDGHHQLGGADWDARVMSHLLDTFVAEHPNSSAGDDEEFMQGLVQAAEELKKSLSTARSRRHNLVYGGDTTRVELTRERFEELTSELLRMTVDITQRTLATAAERGVTKFDDVLLVGGSSRMPAVAEALRGLGLDPRLHDPDLAVAKGAAAFGLIESIKIGLPAEAARDNLPEQAVQEAADQLNLPVQQVLALAGKRVTTVVPRAFGVKVVEIGAGGSETFRIAHVLRANTPLPTRTDPARFGTAYPNQVEIEVEIWEQSGSVESDDPDDNEHIAQGIITGLPPLPQNSPIDITFAMNETGLLSVHAVELKTGKDLDIELRIRGGLSREQVDEARRTIGRYTVDE